MTTTYDGSKLTYTGTEPGNIIIGDPDDAFKGDTEATGKPTINEIRDDYYTRTHIYERACLVIPAAESESESISFANVQNTNFNWQLDTGPQARQVSLTTMQINTKSLMNAGRNLKTTNPLLPGIPITAHMVPCRLLQSLKAGKSTCILLC